MLTIFEDRFFSKNDAKELLSKQGITLSDSFEIKNNESGWAIGDYYHTFTLQISERDRQKAIDQIKRSSDFKKPGSTVNDLLLEIENKYNGPVRTQHYETPTAFVKEYFQPNGEGFSSATNRRLKSQECLFFLKSVRYEAQIISIRNYFPLTVH